MVLEPVHCPDCDGIDVIRHGTTAAGKQRYRCQNSDCPRRTFIRAYSYAAYGPRVKQQISDMAINGSGIRDTARVLGISSTTVMATLKKKSGVDPCQSVGVSDARTDSNHRPPVSSRGSRPRS